MVVEGAKVPNPCVSFAYFSFSEFIMSQIVKAGYENPTPIQAQTIPCVLSGRDCVGVSKTG